MVNAATLRDALRLGDVADQELTATFGTVVSHAGHVGARPARTNLAQACR
jgi:hypothetical protein